MQTYAMVVFDIDGTLISSEHHLLPNTRKILTRLEKKEIPIVLCSARSPSGMAGVAREGGIHGPQVAYNGGLILDEQESIIEENGMTLDEALQIREFITRDFPDVNLSAYLYDVWLTADATHPAIREESRITGIDPLEGHLENIRDQFTTVHKLLCIGAGHQLRKIQERGAELFPDIVFAFSKTTYLEIYAKTASKARALHTLSDHYHIPLKKLVACGDNFNDIEMLELAGLGVAMGNAPDAVKEHADRVTTSNDDDGIYIALKTLRFQKETEA